MLKNFKPGKTHLYQHAIALKNEEPFYIKQYRVPLAYKAEVNSKINKMISNNIIEEKSTPYVSSLFLDHQKPPRIEEELRKLEGVQFLTSFDYYIRLLEKYSQKYTGFMCEGRTFVFKVMPFGDATAVGI